MWGPDRMGRAHDGLMKIRLAQKTIFVAVKAKKTTDHLAEVNLSTSRSNKNKKQHDWFMKKYLVGRTLSSPPPSVWSKGAVKYRKLALGRNQKGYNIIIPQSRTLSFLGSRADPGLSPDQGLTQALSPNSGLSFNPILSTTQRRAQMRHGRP